MKSTWIALLFFTSTLSALEDDFSSDHLIMGTENVSVVSSFDTMTFFTTYSPTGEPLWEAPFTSDVISWKQKEDLLFVFSKARNGMAYFLTCIDAKEGVLVWERRVMSPEFE